MDRTVDLAHRLVIAAPIATIYAALTTEAGIKGWWTPEVVISRRVGGAAILSFEAGARHLRMIIERLEPPTLVQWQCDGGTEPDWIGTTLRFQLTPSSDGENVRVDLAHRDWRPMSETLRSCDADWKRLLLRLKQLAEAQPGQADAWIRSATYQGPSVLPK